MNERYMREKPEKYLKGIKTTFGIRSANYLIRGRHISFPDNNKNQ
jgi:hypothetical protein